MLVVLVVTILICFSEEQPQPLPQYSGYGDAPPRYESDDPHPWKMPIRRSLHRQSVTNKSRPHHHRNAASANCLCQIARLLLNECQLKDFRLERPTVKGQSQTVTMVEVQVRLGHSYCRYMFNCTTSSSGITTATFA